MTSPPTLGQEPGTDVPVCYRHPGRETYIRCTRCDRPICPDCMRDAAVGFQCPECVAGGQRTQRRARTVYGGAVPARLGQVTVAIIGVTVAVWLWEFTTGVGAAEVRFGVVGRGVLNGRLVGIAEGEWYRLVTALFLHASWLHIAFNMYLLWLLGPAIEVLVGRWRFLALYLSAGVGGSAVSYLTGQNGVGASGAIFGLFSAFYIFNRHLRRDNSAIVLLIVLNLVFSFLAPNIGYWAHIGGLVAGAVIAVGYAYAPRVRWRPVLQGTGVALVLVVTAALVALRTSQLT